MTLGEKCIEVALKETQRQNPPIASDLAIYFKKCIRNGKHLSITKGNHCAAFASWTTLQAIQMLENEINDSTLLKPPHLPRAGAKELMVDSIESHTWHKKSEVLEGVWKPLPGDLAIYDRSVPGRPETSWWGHVDRVIQINNDKYENIGANEIPSPGGINRTKIEWTPFNSPRLLGFIAYPQITETKPVHLLDSAEIDYSKNLLTFATSQILKGFGIEADFLSNWKNSVDLGI